MATKKAAKKPKASPKEKTKATAAKLDAAPDFGGAPNPDSAAALASDVLTRFLFHREFPTNPSPTLVRFLAMLVYTTDPNAPTINDIAVMPFFAEHASIVKLLHWSTEDGWTSRRLKTWETWHERVVEASAHQYVEFRTKALGALSKIREKVTSAIDNRITADTFGSDSKTHELVRSLTMLIKAEQELHEVSPTSPRAATEGDASTTTTTMPSKPVSGQTVIGELAAPTVDANNLGAAPITADEARTAAHAVLVLRREQLQLEKTEPTGEK